MDGEAEVPFEASKYNDDRIGRCLDELFSSDRNSIQTEAVGEEIKVHELDIARNVRYNPTFNSHIHNQVKNSPA